MIENLVEIPKKLNLGCGQTKLPGYWNIDKDDAVEPDQKIDICGYLPFASSYFEEVVFFHTIEHIEKKYHPPMLAEIHRVLDTDGRLVLGYPEFAVCAQYWIDNYLGKRDYWEACIYGRQTSPDDFHVSAMHTPELKDLLLSIGFKDITHREEIGNRQYTVLKAIKGEPRITYEQDLTELVFGKEIPNES